MKTYTDEEKEIAAKVFNWFQDRMFMEKYGKRLRKSRYTTLMKIFKASGTYTFSRGVTYFYYFKLRDIGFSPSYKTCYVLYILSIILPLLLSMLLIYFILRYKF